MTYLIPATTRIGALAVGGYAFGKLTSTNPKLMALIWASTIAARDILFYTSYEIFQNRLQPTQQNKEPHSVELIKNLRLRVLILITTASTIVSGSLVAKRLGLIQSTSQFALNALAMHLTSVIATKFIANDVIYPLLFPAKRK